MNIGKEAQESETEGYVYFIADSHSVKIGYSKNPQRRIFQIQETCPTSLSILAIFPGTKKTERILHDKFAHLWMHGEWFRFSGEIVTYIEQVQGGRKIARDAPAIPECKIIPFRKQA